jgi:hypothetical protein
MGTAQIVQRLVLFATATAAIAAVVAYLRDHRVAALAWNGVCPLLILGVGAWSIVQTGPLRFTTAGVLFFVVQGLALAASTIGISRRSVNAALFWSI